MIKIGCNYLSYKSIGIGVEDFIRTCCDLRLDCLDFHRRAFPSDDVSYLLDIKRQCLDLGLPIGYLGVAGGFAGDEDTQRARIEEAKSSIDVALVLGSPLIRVFGRQTHETENRDPLFASLARCLREVCDYGAERGVVVALQNHDNRNLAATGPDVLRIIEDVDHPNFSFIMDTGQWQGSPRGFRRPRPGRRHLRLHGADVAIRELRAVQVLQDRGVEGKRSSTTIASPASSRPQTITDAFPSSMKAKSPDDRTQLIGKAAQYLRGLLAE